MLASSLVPRRPRSGARQSRFESVLKYRMLASNLVRSRGGLARERGRCRGLAPRALSKLHAHAFFQPLGFRIPNTRVARIF